MDSILYNDEIVLKDSPIYINKTKGRMTGEQLNRFEKHGYLVIEDLLPSEILDAVESEITNAIDRCVSDLVAAGKLSMRYSHLPFTKRLAAITAETGEAHRAIRAGRLCGSGVFGLLTAPPLLDVAEQLCGPDLVASSVYRLRPKLPGEKLGEVPWHQDSGYFEPACDNSLILTAWIPLISATAEMGCLWLIPGVHKGPIYKHSPHDNKISLEIRKEDLPKESPICVPVPRGGVLLMSNKTPHASFENSSDIIRWSVDVRYQSMSLPTNAPLPERAREANSPSTNLSAGCFPPEADFLVRSARYPEGVLTSAEAFRRLREAHEALPLTDRWGVNKLAEKGLFRALNGSPNETE